MKNKTLITPESLIRPHSSSFAEYMDILDKGEVIQLVLLTKHKKICRIALRLC
jgi:hypothetical protein